MTFVNPGKCPSTNAIEAYLEYENKEHTNGVANSMAFDKVYSDGWEWAGSFETQINDNDGQLPEALLNQVTTQYIPYPNTTPKMCEEIFKAGAEACLKAGKSE